MFSKIWLTNILLTAMVLLVGLQAYRIWFEEGKKIPSINSVKETSSTFEKKMYKKKEVPSVEYETVATNNLFAEDRSESKPVETPTDPNAKPKADEKMMELIKKEVEKITLYGVLITENEKKALVNNLEMKAPTIKARKVFGPSFLKRAVKSEKPAVLVPVSSGDRLKWVKQGDQIGKLRVMDIRNNSILLGAEGMDFLVFLYEKKGKRSVAPLKKETGPVIVSVGPGAKTVPTPVKTAPAKPSDLVNKVKATLKPTANIPAASERKNN